MSHLLPFLILITLLSNPLPALALEPQQGFLISAYFLDGNLDLKPAFAFDGIDNTDHDLIEYGVGGGYAFGNGFTAELRFIGGTSDALDIGIDSYDIIEFQLAAAYDWYFSPRFSVGPELRLSDITLYADEDSWYSSEPDEKWEVEDSALGWALRGKWRTTQVFTMALEYGQSYYKFGNIRTIGLALQWHI
jgi:hypothetical protein